MMKGHRIHFTTDYESPFGNQQAYCGAARDPIWDATSDDWRRVECVNCRSAWPIRNAQRWSTHKDRGGWPRAFRRWAQRQTWYTNMFDERLNRYVDYDF